MPKRNRKSGKNWSLDNQKSYLVFRFDGNYDIEEANEFIKKWQGYAFIVAVNYTKFKFKNLDRQTQRSASLEALMTTYLYIKSENVKSESTIKGIISHRTRITCIRFAIMEGAYKNRRKSVGYIDYKSDIRELRSLFDNDTTYDYLATELDNGILNQIIEMIDGIEYKIMKLYIQGYKIKEIAQILKCTIDKVKYRFNLCIRILKEKLNKPVRIEL